MALEPHVAKWWDIANDRRQRLIQKKYKGGGLSLQQQAEFALLQGICDMIMSYAAPIDFSHLERLTRKAEKLAARISKLSLKAKKEAAK